MGTISSLGIGRLGARVFSLGAVSAAAFSLQVAAARAEPRLRDVGPVYAGQRARSPHRRAPVRGRFGGRARLHVARFRRRRRAVELRARAGVPVWLLPAARARRSAANAAWTAASPARRARRVAAVVGVGLRERERTWRWRVEVPAQPSDHLVAALGRRLFVLSRTTLKTVRLPAALHTPSATEPVR
jgi:hypothetical protein